MLLQQGPDAMLVAGGTDLYPNMKRRQFTPKYLVGLRRVEGLSHIRNGSASPRQGPPPLGLRLGALATLTEVAASPLVRERYPALAYAAGVVSTPQLRNAGTIGGNLCLDTRCNWYDQSLFWRMAEGYCMKTHPEVVCRVAPASPRCWAVASADTPPVLIALDATVRIWGQDGEREVRLLDLYRDDGIRYLSLEPGEIVTEIRIPAEPGWRAAYKKLRDRGAFDFPVVGVAAAVRLDGGVVADARVVVTAVGSRPVLVEKAGAALRGTRLEDEAIERAAQEVFGEAKPLDNTSGTIAERKRAARVFTARALRELRGWPYPDRAFGPSGAP